MKESAENYLEAIYVLSKEQPNVRSIDVVNYMEFSKPSISIAMKKLKEKNLINIDKDGFIKFTETGKSVASDIFEKHTLLTKIFIHLGVSEETAKEDACRVEHYISNETFQAIKKSIKNL